MKPENIKSDKQIEQQPSGKPDTNSFTRRLFLHTVGLGTSILSLQQAAHSKKGKPVKENEVTASISGELVRKDGVVEITMNGLTISIDEQTGTIIGLAYPGPGKMLEAKPEGAGIVDMAYPVSQFEPLRLAARYSKGTKVEKSDDGIMISWDNLGPSRSFYSVSGKVSAKVWLKEMPGGRSISMKCFVENKSDLPVGQILFPDFHGLLPFSGKETTILRTAGFTRRPFVDIRASEYPEFYASERRSDRKEFEEYIGGGRYAEGDHMIGRWFDFGGLKGGFSVFPKLWYEDPLTRLRIHRLEKDPNVRLMHKHDIQVKPGETWESPEYILTPHRQGWAKGIEPYREFVKSKIKRFHPLPQHVKEGFGFRTIWACKGFPADGKRDIAFMASDLPKVARECIEHGLDEMVIWFWHEPFTLPAPPPYSHLGTPEEFAGAIKECNRIGVNVSLFISILSIAEPTASRYGWKVGPGWTYHNELIPRYNPGYANGRRTVVAQPNDPKYPMWSEEVIGSVKTIYEKYTHSITWDQAHPGTEEIFKQFLPLVKEHDPRATFSGEITGRSEKAANFLDYTWNWESGSYHHNLMTPYRDDRAFLSAFPTPRLNKNINRNASHIRIYFMDNGYVNVMPTAPDDANGTAWINNYPEVSRALKQCAALRKQFLTYFTDGTLIGECLLKATLTGAHVNAYLLPDKILLILINTQDEERRLRFRVDIEPWLRSDTGRYEIRSYDQYGKSLKAGATTGYEWRGVTGKLKKSAFAIFEFIVR